MDDKIEKFDPSTLMQGVKDRIKATFVSLIPDGQWEELVQKEIDAFFNETSKLEVSKKTEQTGDYWHRKQYLVTETEQTPFRAIVWGHCLDLTYETLKEKITKEFFSDKWVNNQNEITDGMKKVIEDSAALGLTNFFRMITLNMTQDLRNQISQIR